MTRKEDKSNTPRWLKKIKEDQDDIKTILKIAAIVLAVGILFVGLLVELDVWGIVIIVLLFVFL
jgi:hypothetical protein